MEVVLYSGMRKVWIGLVAVCVCVGVPAMGLAQTVAVRFPAAVSGKALDGRLMVLLSNDPSEEPRMQINDTMASQQVFGVTVDGMRPGQAVVVGRGAVGFAGYPRASLKDVPAGDYTVQAVLNVYETFHRADGERGEAGAGSGRGEAVECRAGESLFEAGEGACRAGGGGEDFDG